MMTLFERLATRWIARHARPDRTAVEAARLLKPAVVVTGGSEGIGLAIARCFADLGCPLVLVARNSDRLQSAADSLRQSHRATVHVLSCDLTRNDAIDELTVFLDRQGLYCDVLVNNAAIGLGGPFVSHAEAQIAQLMELNIAGPTRLIRRLLPAMLARGRGGILNVASLGGFVPGPHQAAYYASKAYVISLTRAIAEEVAGRGVRVCVIAPGPVETSFHARMGADDALYRRLIPAASPERVAASAVRGYRLGRRVVGGRFITGLASYGLRVLPQALTVPLIGWLLRVRPDDRYM
jgi:short-subunit dehydrogenase